MINFIDIGASAGEMTDQFVGLMNRLKIEYRVFAFEPFRADYEALVKKYESNHRIQVMPQACSDYNGKGNLYRSVRIGGHSLKKEKINIQPDVFDVVDVIKFSEWFTVNIPDSDFSVVKINVEGSEYELYTDIIESKINKSINLFCGSLGDLYKIGKPEKEINDFLDYLEKNKIVVHTLTPNDYGFIVDMERFILDNKDVVPAKSENEIVRDKKSTSRTAQTPEVSVGGDLPWFEPEKAKPKKKPGRKKAGTTKK